MMAIETLPFDAALFLVDATAQSELIADALESGNASYIATALGTVARARGMSKVAKEAGVTREALYKALAPTGDPRLSTLLGVMKALGIKLIAAPMTDEAA
jgi:probable addiction module antidote protein